MLRLLRHVTRCPCPAAADEGREALMATLMLEVPGPCTLGLWLGGCPTPPGPHANRNTRHPTHTQSQSRSALPLPHPPQGVYNALAYCLSNAVNQTAFVAAEKRQVLGKQPADGTLGHALACVRQAKKEVPFYLLLRRRGRLLPTNGRGGA